MEKYTEEQIQGILMHYPSIEEYEYISAMREYKQKLADTDYMAIKYSEGYYTDEEYQPIKEERESYREKIRELEKNYGKE